MYQTTEHDKTDGEEVSLEQQLYDLTQSDEYTLTQINGQKVYRRKPGSWPGEEPSLACEIFIGRLPRDISEAELIPLFAKAGVLYEFRLLMQFSGYNRGYGFAMYTNPDDALYAIEMFEGYKIRSNWTLGVCPSLNNSLVFIGKVPLHITVDHIVRILTAISNEVIKVSQRFNLNSKNLLVEFKSHRGAAIARKALIPVVAAHWGPSVTADWSVPVWELDLTPFVEIQCLNELVELVRLTPNSIPIRQELPPEAKQRRMKMIAEAHALSQRRRAENPIRSLASLSSRMDQYVRTPTPRENEQPFVQPFVQPLKLAVHLNNAANLRAVIPINVSPVPLRRSMPRVRQTVDDPNDFTLSQMNISPPVREQKFDEKQHILLEHLQKAAKRIAEEKEKKEAEEKERTYNPCDFYWKNE